MIEHNEPACKGFMPLSQRASRRHAHGSPGRSIPAVGLSPAGEAQVVMAVGRLLGCREEAQLELLAAVLALFGSCPCPLSLHQHTTWFTLHSAACERFLRAQSPIIRVYAAAPSVLLSQLQFARHSSASNAT